MVYTIDDPKRLLEVTRIRHGRDVYQRWCRILSISFITVKGHRETLSPSPILVYLPSDTVAPRGVPAGVLQNVSVFANLSRSGVIRVTARMPIQEFHTLFAKESLA